MTSSSHQTSQTSQTFPHFTSLPLELRIMIYQQSLTPRLLQVSYSIPHHTCISLTAPPPLLLVSRETRREALRFYSRSFGTRFKAHSAIYFNAEIDVVEFEFRGFQDNYVSNCMRWEEAAGVRWMRMREGTVGWLVGNQMRELGGFGGLRGIEVVGCGEEGKGDARDGVDGDAVVGGKEVDGEEEEEWEERREICLERLRGWLVGDEGEGEEETSKIAKRKAVERRQIPKLVCVDGGGKCKKHSWFKEWNEWSGLATSDSLEKSYWTSMFAETWRDIVG